MFRLLNTQLELKINPTSGIKFDINGILCDLTVPLNIENDNKIAINRLNFSN